MPDGRRRSREHWTDAMEAGPPATPTHTHRLPPVVRLASFGLVAATFLLLIAVALLMVQSQKTNDYIQGKGEDRDRENARTNQRINDAICDLLDQLPEGGLLERPRAKYGCGPGIPITQLTPQERQQLSGRPTASVPPRAIPAPASSTPAPSSRQSPTAPAQQPATPSATPKPAPPPPPPVLDLSGLTGPFCESAIVCF